MTNLMIDYDPNDTGEIPRIDDLGTDPTRNLAKERDAILNSLGNLRDSSFDIDDTVTYLRIPETIGVVDMPVAQWERIVDTEQLTVLGSLAGAHAGIDGELEGPQKPPPPIPPQPAPGKYRGQHRLTLAGRWRRLPWQARAFTQLAGIVVTAAAILWVMA